MKDILIHIILIQLLSSCTAIGITIDSRDRANNLKEALKADKIDREDQPITVINKMNGKIQGSFEAFIYKYDSTENAVSSLSRSNPYNGINFPAIGDSISVQIENVDSLEGIFSGISHKEGTFHLMATTKDSTVVKAVPITSITNIEGSTSKFVLENPKLNNFYLVCSTSKNTYELPLTRLKHLNYKEPKRHSSATVAGILFDLGTIIYMGLQARLWYNRANDK